MLIKRIIAVGNETIKAEYDSETGIFGFTRADDAYSFNSSKGNAFRTVRMALDAFSDIEMPTIKFMSMGVTQRDADLKDRFYCRVLKNRGYHEVPTRLCLRDIISKKILAYFELKRSKIRTFSK